MLLPALITFKHRGRRERSLSSCTYIEIVFSNQYKSGRHCDKSRSLTGLFLSLSSTKTSLLRCLGGFRQTNIFIKGDGFRFFFPSPRRVDSFKKAFFLLLFLSFSATARRSRESCVRQMARSLRLGFCASAKTVWTLLVPFLCSSSSHPLVFYCMWAVREWRRMWAAVEQMRMQCFCGCRESWSLSNSHHAKVSKLRDQPHDIVSLRVFVFVFRCCLNEKFDVVTRGRGENEKSNDNSFAIITTAHWESLHSKFIVNSLFSGQAGKQASEQQQPERRDGGDLSRTFLPHYRHDQFVKAVALCTLFALHFVRCIGSCLGACLEANVYFMLFEV